MRVAVRAAVLAMSALLAAPAPAAYEAFLAPQRSAEVGSDEVGLLVRIAVVEGDTVSGGDVLAELDADLQRAAHAASTARAAARGEERSASALLALREQRFARLAALAADGNARADELAQARAERDVARAALESARETRRLRELEADVARLRLERRTLRSPFDGVVQRVHKETGEMLRGEDDVLATIVDLAGLRAEFHLLPADAVALAGRAQVVIDCDGRPGTPALIELTDPVTDAESGTVRVRVRVDNTDRALRGGTRCVLTP